MWPTTALFIGASAHPVMPQIACAAATGSHGMCRVASGSLGAGIGRRDSTVRIGSLEVLRQTVRPLVVRRRDG